MNYTYKIEGKLCSNKLYHQRCQPLEISNLWTSTPPPTEFANATPPQVLFWFGPPPLPLPSSPQAILWGKCQSICQGLQLVEYSSNQTLIFIGVTKKKLSSFCLQQKMCIMQENEARNCNTSISQIILEFWNIWSLNLSFLWATDPNFLLSGSFGHP